MANATSAQILHAIRLLTDPTLEWEPTSPGKLFESDGLDYSEIPRDSTGVAIIQFTERSYAIRWFSEDRQFLEIVDYDRGIHDPDAGTMMRFEFYGEVAEF